MSDASAPEFSISTDAGKLDVAWIVHSVLDAYWGGHLAGAQIRAALQESLVFGAYNERREPMNLSPHAPKAEWVHSRQIGFVRVVTDGAIFSSVTDVLVAPEHRNKGVGSALMREVIAHPGVAGTICILASRPEAWSWYQNFGFVLVDRKSGIMQRQPT